MIPEQQQQQSYQNPPSPIPQPQHQPHTSTINSLINPPQPADYDRPYQNVASQENVPQSSTPQSQTASGVVAEQRKPEEKARTTKGKYTLSDFIIQRTLGTGSFGRVHLVQSRHNLRFYAIKVLKKGQVVKMKQVEHTNDERKMLQKVKHPFLVTLWGTFQDTRNLYMVMDFIEGGELFSLLRKSQVRTTCSVCVLRYES
jgi:protein kinase A